MNRDNCSQINFLFASVVNNLVKEFNIAIEVDFDSGSLLIFLWFNILKDITVLLVLHLLGYSPVTGFCKFIAPIGPQLPFEEVHMLLLDGIESSDDIPVDAFIAWWMW